MIAHERATSGFERMDQPRPEFDNFENVATFGGGNDFFKAWGSTDKVGASRLIDVCLDHGVCMFDSADGYSGGMAEEILGAAIKGKRDRLLISTKATFPTGAGPNDFGSSRQHLVDAVEKALKRLGTDYIDLFQLHGQDFNTPVEETLSTLDTFVRAGKIRYVGCLQFLWLAPDEVAGRLGPLRLSAPCRAPGLLLAAQPGLRMGADAARAATRASAA